MVKIVSRKLIGTQPVYDIGVERDHNFLVKNGWIASNCFNKSHSTAYAYVTYQTAYLKANYTVEYMTALLTSNSGDQDKVKKYLAYCLSMGIVVEPPDINRSEVEFTPIEGNILFGLSAVKNVGETAIACILEARSKEGPFKSLADLCDRVDLRAANSRTLESLIKCGAFDKLDPNRQQLVKDLEFVTKWAQDRAKDREIGQGNLFDLIGFAEPGASGKKSFESIPKAPLVPDFTSKEKLQFEKELLGCYVSEHPLKFAKQAAENLGIETISLGELEEQRGNAKIKAIVTIADIKNVTTKKGDRMAILQIEDIEGQAEAVVFPKTYAEVNAEIVADTPLIVSGKVDKQDERTQILVEKIETIDPEHLTRAKPKPQPVLEDIELLESESVAIAPSLPQYSRQEEPRQSEPPAIAPSSPQYSRQEEPRQSEPPAIAPSLPQYSIQEEPRQSEPPAIAPSSPQYFRQEDRRQPETPAIAPSLRQPVGDRSRQPLPALMMMVMLTDVKREIAKNGDRLLRLKIKDIAGEVEALVLPQSYELILNVLEDINIPIPGILRGKKEQYGEQMQLIVDNIMTLEASERVIVELTQQQVSDRGKLDLLRRLLQEYSGEKETTKVPVVAIVAANRQRKLICLERDVWVQSCQQAANLLRSAGFTAYVQSLTGE